ncbi:MAG: hypothetical protein JST15_10625 [Bacteroidetes bacterium]|nr:hypothetical protein [Bacteroidota bacterium]
MTKTIFTAAIYCLLISVLISGITYGQGFNSVTTPDGVNLIAVGNNGKVYRSANSGLTWFNTVYGSANLNSVSAFANDVWIASANGNVYKTLKTSSSYTSYNTGSSNNLYGVYFINSSTGFVCGESGSVYKSVNGGINWTLSNSGISSVKLNSISFSSALKGRVVGNNGVIYYTNNGGSSWSMEKSGITFNLLKIKQFNDSAVAVGENGTLLVNTSGGWTNVASRVRTDIRGVTGTSMNDVHLCGGGGFIRNNKSGNAKFSNFEQNPMHANLVDIFYYDINKGWAVSSLNSVIIYTTNGGTSWNMPAGSTLTRTWVSKLTASGGIGNNLCEHPFDRNTLFVVYGSTVYVSRNRGDNWTSIATIPGGGAAHSFYVSPLDTNIWMTAITGSPDKVKRSTNYGATWTDIVSLNFSNYGQPLEMDQNNPNNYYFAPDGGGFYRSTNNGASFTEISGNYPFRSPCDIIVMWDSSNVIYLGDGVTGSGQAKIFKSTNNGVNWTDMYTVTSSETPSLCNSVFDRSLAYATEWSGSGFYKTTNYGVNWSLAGTTGSSGWGSDICHEDPTVVLKGTYGSPHYLTTNSGQSFVSTSLGGGAGAGIIVPDRSYLISMQTGGLFKMTFTYTDSSVSMVTDVQALSIGNSGTQYFPTATITPTGTVRNNNGVASATFNVTRKITPGNYVSTKTVTNLGANSTANINFDQFTFNSGTAYTVKDSVFISGDEVPGNDVITASFTPYVGQGVTRLSEGFSGTFPPTGWSFDFTGTNYWQYSSSVSSYGNGTGSSFFNFWNAANGTIQSLLTPAFTASVSGDSIGYDYAYGAYSSGTDSIIIETSTNGGSSYTTLVGLYGNASSPIGGLYSMSTAPASGSRFTPASNQWLTRKWALPVGTTKIKFRANSGFGNDFFLDSVRILGGSAYTQVNLKVAPEGFYNGTGLNMKDTVRVYLRNTVSPFAKVDSSKVILDDITLTAAAVFMNAPSGTYYFQIEHRNAIETWSKAGGESITRGVLKNYDFTSAQSQTYGGNSILNGSKWLMYSGDVNRDGVIDASDMSDIDNNASNSVFGYFSTDLNGDDATDASDLSIVDNNAMNSITKVTPQLSPSDIMNLKSGMKIKNDDYKRKSSSLK